MRTQQNLLLAAGAASLAVDSPSFYTATSSSFSNVPGKISRSSDGKEVRAEGRSRRRRESIGTFENDEERSHRRSEVEANIEFYDFDSFDNEEKRKLVETSLAIMDSTSIDWDNLKENYINSVRSERSQQTQLTQLSLRSQSADAEEEQVEDVERNLQRNKRAQERFRKRQQRLRRQHHAAQHSAKGSKGSYKYSKGSYGTKGSAKYSKWSAKGSKSGKSSKASYKRQYWWDHPTTTTTSTQKPPTPRPTPRPTPAPPTIQPSAQPSVQGKQPPASASPTSPPQDTTSAPTLAPSAQPSSQPTPVNYFGYKYDDGNCPDAGSFGVPCYDNSQGRISEICDKYNHEKGSFRKCLEVCTPSFCCIHDALPPPENGPTTGTNYITPHCNQDENCPQYTYCYIIWWKLHDTIGPAVYLRIEQDDDFYDMEAEDIQEDQTGDALFTQVLLHHFDDVAQVILNGTVDGEFSAKRVFDNRGWWDFVG